MNSSKRLALIGFRSSLSISKLRGLCSSYRLIDRRHISQFTKDSNPSNNSHMETLQDSSPQLLNSQDHYYSAFRHTTEKLRAEVEKMQTERGKNSQDSSPQLINAQEHHFADSRPETIKVRAKVQKLRLELAEVEKMLTERADVEKMRNELLMSGFEINTYIRPSKAINEYTNTMSEGFREFKAELEATKRQITRLGIASMTPFLLILIVLMATFPVS